MHFVQTVCRQDSNDKRGSEMTKFIHRGLKGKLLRLANIISLDRYTHDEKLTPELLRLMDEERRLAYHTHFLRQVAQSSPVVEVGWDMEEILPSLRFIAEK